MILRLARSPVTWEILPTARSGGAANSPRPRALPIPGPHRAGVNPYVDASQDNQSTFALDVDTASYTVARRFITDGNLPDPASVRVEEVTSRTVV